jgi:hypothetical protein
MASWLGAARSAQREQRIGDLGQDRVSVVNPIAVGSLLGRQPGCGARLRGGDGSVCGLLGYVPGWPGGGAV